MNVKHLKSVLVGGLMVAALSFVSVGCNENEVDPPTGDAPAAPTAAKAVSLSATGVGVMWTASVDSGVSYTVEAVSTGTVPDTKTANNISGTSVSFNDLTQGKTYTFSVYSVRNGVKSATAATVIWAPAQRESSSGQKMRLYEYASSNGSGLTVDPAKGGPKNISVKNPSGEVQLALYNLDKDGANDTLLIGAAYAIEEYRNVNAFDSSTYVSPSIYAIPSLDTWYEDQPLTSRFDGSGNLYYYKVLEKVSGNNTYMFYMRTGQQGNYHYARILIKKDNNGNIFQGSAPNRYVEVEISYQTVTDLPYAKVPAGTITPTPVIRATRGL